MANVFDKFLKLHQNDNDESLKLLQYFSLFSREKLGKLFSAREFSLKRPNLLPRDSTFASCWMVPLKYY